MPSSKMESPNPRDDLNGILAGVTEPSPIRKTLNSGKPVDNFLVGNSPILRNCYFQNRGSKK
jgi:hypothetical protein